MREELTQIELIEQYLLGKLSANEKQQVTQRIEADPKFKQAVEKQKILMEGIKRSALKKSAKKGFKKYKTMKAIKYLTATIVTIGVATVLYVALNDREVKTTSPEEILPEQSYTLNNALDTVIETENDMTLVIPANAFVNEQGETVNEVNFEVKEAFKTSDILKAGLTTLSDGKLLETGGMFFLNAYDKKGNKLQLAKDKKTLADIPNLNPRNDMMLFDGEKQADGSINWVNPKPIQKDLITYDITTLDFYPEGYLEELKYKSVGKMNGKELFMNNCASCHHPTKGGTGPALQGTKYKWEKNGDNVYEFIRNPQAQYDAGVKSALAIQYNVGGMNGQAVSDDEIDAIFDYIASPNDPRFDKTEQVRTSIDISNKQFTDSLYYSFARLFEEKLNVGVMPYVEDEAEVANLVEESIPEIANQSNIAKINQLNANSGSITYIPENELYGADTLSYEGYDDSGCPTPKGINPARIKAIWNKKYNNTILATKEFEQRLKVIHQAHDDALLSIYVNNIDKPLWYSDSLASTIAGQYQSQFLAFYKEKKGGVRVNDDLAKKLAEYYENKQKTYTSKSSEIFQEYQAKKKKLKDEFMAKKTNKNIQEFNRKSEVLLEEYDLNMENVCYQLKRNNCGQSASERILTEVKTLGPKNIDAYVWDATVDRTTLNYTDPKTGKKAVIKYEEATVKITNKETFDRVFVYMIPDSLSSFNRMNSKDNINFKNNLNELLNYQLVCLAYKGEQAYVYKGELQSQHYDVTLAPITDDELKSLLDKEVETGKTQNITADINFFKEEMVFNEAKAKFKANDELTLKIGTFLFPMLDKNCILQSRNVGYKFGSESF